MFWLVKKLIHLKNIVANRRRRRRYSAGSPARNTTSNRKSCSEERRLDCRTDTILIDWSNDMWKKNVLDSSSEENLEEGKNHAKKHWRTAHGLSFSEHCVSSVWRKGQWSGESALNKCDKHLPKGCLESIPEE